jgi:hypothetical protein
MNLSKFLNTVDSLSQSMEKEQLTAFVHDIARVLPENARNDFLDRMKKSKSDKNTDSLHTRNDYAEVDKNNYERIKDKLTKIENWEICLSGDLNEEYDDWYNSDADEFIFADPEGIGEIIEEAYKFVHTCVDKELYKEGYEISEMLIGLKIMVGGGYQDYSDEPLGIEELEQYDLSRLNYKILLTDALYLTYGANPLEDRSDALYILIQNAGEKDISLEKIMQCGEELPEFHEFLPIWTAYLGDKNSYIAQKLLEEAIELSNNSENLLSNARIYYEQHPGLYEKYMKENRDKISSEEMLLIGKEALEQIDTKYLVRSRIALLMADIILNEKSEVTKEIEQCWLEAFRSDTRVVHYIRMMMECNDFSVWKEELQNINHNMLKKMKSRNVYCFDKSTDLRENTVDIENAYLIALLNGEFKYVKDHGLNYNGALGWSSSYMKKGLAAFLMILMNKEELSEGGKAMLSKIVSSVAFSSGEYRQGTSVEINETDMEWFWKCFRRSKVLHPMTESDQKIYLGWIEKLIKKRVDGIMEGNHRNYYNECAEYIAALGEVLESRGLINDKQILMLEYKQNYSRRSAFHKELRTCGMKDGRK